MLRDGGFFELMSEGKKAKVGRYKAWGEIHNAITPGGGGVLPKKLGRGVRPASQNPYPNYDQNLRFSLPYL